MNLFILCGVANRTIFETLGNYMKGFGNLELR